MTSFKSTSSKSRTDEAPFVMDPHARLEKVRVFVSPIENEPLLNVIRGVENFFTLSTGTRRFECMWTHFSVELIFSGGRRALLERNDNQVVLSQRDMNNTEIETWTVAPASPVTFNDVLDFYHREKNIPYMFHIKNCKHLCYEFMVQVVRSYVGPFPDFCAWQESIYQSKTA